jgi:hypothetical protein
MRERITRSRDPAPAGPGPAIASRETNSQPPPALAWQTRSQKSDRSDSAASDGDLKWFGLRIIRAIQSSARKRHDG